MSALPLALQSSVSYLDAQAQQRLAEAYVLAEAAHDGMMRKSGDPFITHPVAVTEILADMNLDTDALIAGLLHDTVEDTDVTFEQIETSFGPNVRRIVEGETKISKLTVRVYEDEQSENLRQMLLAMVGDVRIIIVKLADRLHNMRTLGSMPPHKQQKIARETIEIFAPLAHRLGISHIKNELEDLSFQYLEPEKCDKLRRQVKMRHNERDLIVQKTIDSFRSRLAEDGLCFEVSGRSKHLYSIQRKMERDGKSLDQIFDLTAIRVIIDPSGNGTMKLEEKEAAVCYRALGIAHSLWTPIPGRFKDYIAVPKPNGYQSLHTTVIGFEGQPIEVQIRTRRMHEVAEYGVAAHWAYKQGLSDQEEIEKRLEWMKQLLDVDNAEESAGAFIEAVKQDLLSERVVVFTPQGDTVNLARGSTPIDFAYHIHTEVGHRCVGARINGEIVPLNYTLQTGDQVEILTNRSAKYGPSSDWLGIAVTRSAKQKIRQHFRHKERQGVLETSRRGLERALRRKQLSVAQYTSREKLESVAKKLLKTDSVDELLLALHSKRLTNKQIIEVLAPPAPNPQPVPPPTKPSKRSDSTNGIYVDGLEAPAKLARCCAPVRGDDVLGYVTRGHGISVHRVDCPNIKNLLRKDSERFVNVTWDAPAEELYPVDFEVVGVDRAGLLRDVLMVIGEMNKSATRVGAVAQSSSQAHIHFRVDVRDHAEIEFIKDSVQKIVDVTEVYRAKPGLKS